MIVILAIEFWLFQHVAQPSPLWRVIGLLLVMMVLWSFIMTAFTDPGTETTPEWTAWKIIESESRKAKEIQAGCERGLGEGREESVSSTKTKKEWAPGDIQYCNFCDHIRPERSHHCRQCNRCVLRMDHHCPLIGNCVGWRNHKHYMLLQFWQFWACVVFLVAPGSPGSLAVSGFVDGIWLELLLDIGVAWAVVIMIIAGKTWVVSVFMAAQNVTHIERNFFAANPYALNMTENLRQLFGPLDIRLLFPVACDRQCSGTSFPTASNNCAQKLHSCLSSVSKSGGSFSEESAAATPYGTV